MENELVTSGSNASTYRKPAHERLYELDQQRKLKIQFLQHQQNKTNREMAVPQLVAGPSRNIVRDGEVSERLYNIARQQKLKEIEEERTDETDSRGEVYDAYTGQQLFKPKINKTSERMAIKQREREPHSLPIEELLNKKGDLYKKKQNDKELQYERKLQQQRDIPKVNPISEKIVQERQLLTGETTQDRLSKPIGMVKPQTLNDIEQPSFKPILSKKTQELNSSQNYYYYPPPPLSAPPQDTDRSIDGYDSDNTSHHRYHRTNLKTRRSSHVETFRNRHGQKTHAPRYYFLDANDQPQELDHSSYHDEQVLPNITSLRPRSLSPSDSIYYQNLSSSTSMATAAVGLSGPNAIYMKSKRWDELRAQRLARERIEREKEIYKECSFKPKIEEPTVKVKNVIRLDKPKGKSFDGLEGGSDDMMESMESHSGLTISERQALWVQKREEKLALERQRNAEKEIKECSFAPMIPTNKVNHDLKTNRSHGHSHGKGSKLLNQDESIITQSMKETAIDPSIVKQFDLIESKISTMLGKATSSSMESTGNNPYISKPNPFYDNKKQQFVCQSNVKEEDDDEADNPVSDAEPQGPPKRIPIPIMSMKPKVKVLNAQPFKNSEEPQSKSQHNPAAVPSETAKIVHKKLIEDDQISQKMEEKLEKENKNQQKEDSNSQGRLGQINGINRGIPHPSRFDRLDKGHAAPRHNTVSSGRGMENVTDDRIDLESESEWTAERHSDEGMIEEAVGHHDVNIRKGQSNRMRSGSDDPQQTMDVRRNVEPYPDPSPQLEVNRTAQKERGAIRKGPIKKGVIITTTKQSTPRDLPHKSQDRVDIGGDFASNTNPKSNRMKPNSDANHPVSSSMSSSSISSILSRIETRPPPVLIQDPVGSGLVSYIIANENDLWERNEFQSQPIRFDNPVMIAPSRKPMNKNIKPLSVDPYGYDNTAISLFELSAMSSPMESYPNLFQSFPQSDENWKHRYFEENNHYNQQNQEVDPSFVRSDISTSEDSFETSFVNNPPNHSNQQSIPSHSYPKNVGNHTAPRLRHQPFVDTVNQPSPSNDYEVHYQNQPTTPNFLNTSYYRSGTDAAATAAATTSRLLAASRFNSFVEPDDD